jgi:acyl-CoA thioesterase FadM
VQVFFDYDAGASCPMPAEVRERIERFEAGAPD